MTDLHTGEWRTKQAITCANGMHIPVAATFQVVDRGERNAHLRYDQDLDTLNITILRRVADPVAS